MECPNDQPLFDLSNNHTLALIHGLARFQKFYAPIHGVVCVALCVFGILTNLVHMVVLSRPAMRQSAVNCLLTAVAICDVGTMASYLTYIFHFVIRRQNTCDPTFTHGWMQFLLWHVVLSICLHTTSLWLAVAMAFIRRMTLRVARLNSQWQRPQFAWKLCFAIYLIVFILCVPNMIVHDITVYEGGMWEPSPRCKASYPSNYSERIYTFLVSPFATANNCRMFKANIWMIGILFKVIPCILLFILSVGLMTRIRDAENNRRKLTNNSTSSAGTSVCKNKKPKSDRTTAMLVVIVVVFLITELPQGVISILCAIYTADVHRYLYFYLGDILDLLSLVNSSVNFVLYCVMSSRYRQTFWTVVLPRSAYEYFMKSSGNGQGIGFSVVGASRKNNSKSKCHDYFSSDPATRVGTRASAPLLLSVRSDQDRSTPLLDENRDSPSTLSP